jgi:hypothetical protein
MRQFDPMGKLLDMSQELTGVIGPVERSAVGWSSRLPISP